MLEYRDIPTTEPTVVSDCVPDLVDAISLAIGPYRGCSHFTIAQNGPQSCRLFMVEQYANAVPFNRELGRSPESIAKELMRFAHQDARYPAREDQLKGRKGWAIRKIELDGKPVAVAEAAWVS